MTLLLAALVGVLVLGIALAAAVILGRRLHGESDAATPDLARIARWTATWRWAGVATGLVIGVLAFLSAQQPVALGRLALAAPALAAAGVLAGVAIGEATARPTRTPARTASLSTRSWRTLLPRTRTMIVGGGLGILAVLLVIGAVTGSPDDAGRAGRALKATCAVDLPGVGTTIQTAINSPWPGSFYAVPAAVAVGACLALAVAAGIAIHRRANPDAASGPVDLRLRSDAMANLVSAVGVLAFGTAGPIALVMATDLHSNDCVAGGSTYAGMLLALALGCTVAAIAMLAHLLLPRRRTVVSATQPAAARSPR